MNLKEFEKRKAIIWAKHERDYGYPICRQIRDHVEEMNRVNSHEEETLDDLDGYLATSIPIWKEIPRCTTDSNLADAKPKEIRRKWLERRFYLIDFVVDRGRNKQTNRIDWKRIVTKWNKVNPNDTMTIPVLKVEFYKAMQEVPLIQQYVLRYLVEVVCKYKQIFQNGEYVTEWDRYKGSKAIIDKIQIKDYQEFSGNLFEKITFVLKKNRKLQNHVWDIFKQSFERILPILESIQEIRETKLLEREQQLLKQIKQREEAQHERINTVKR